jgi:uncharacterized membrane protein
VTVTEPTLQREQGHRRDGLAIAWTAYLVYTVHALTRWRQHRVAGFDLGIFDQIVRHYAHLQPPIVSLKGPNFNALGDHFHPILVVLAPLYHVWDDARVLLLAQAALVAISVWVVHRFAARHLDRRTAAVAAAVYALGWPLQNMIDYDFHEIAFAVPLLAIAIDALDRQSDRALLWSALTLLLVREDMGVVVACLGLVRLSRRPRWPALLLAVVGPATFFLVTKFVIPHFGLFGYWTYQALGPDLPSAARFVLVHPLDTLQLLVSPPVKAEKLVLLFAPVAFLALRSRYLLPVLPLLASALLSSRPALWGTTFHHSSVLWPIIFLAAVHGAVLLRLPERRRAWLAVRLLVVAIPVLGVLAGWQNYPLHRLITGEAFAMSDHQRDAVAFTAAVPPGTCVEADDNVTVFLTHTNLVSIRGLLGRPPDFYAIDLAKADMFHVPPGRVHREALEAGYTEVLEEGDLVLLQRPGYRGPTPECAPG